MCSSWVAFLLFLYYQTDRERVRVSFIINLLSIAKRYTSNSPIFVLLRSAVLISYLMYIHAALTLRIYFLFCTELLRYNSLKEIDHNGSLSDIAALVKCDSRASDRQSCISAIKIIFVNKCADSPSREPG